MFVIMILCECANPVICKVKILLQMTNYMPCDNTSPMHLSDWAVFFVFIRRLSNRDYVKNYSWQF